MLAFAVPPTTLEYTVAGMGPWCPVVGAQLVVICANGPPTLGVATSPSGGSEIFARTTVPLGAGSWTVRWADFTTEYPEWVGTAFNTFADLSVTSPTWSGSLTALGPDQPLHVNDPRIHPLRGDSTDPFGDEGGTHWWRSTIPVSAGEELEIAASLTDDSEVLPSCLLIDGMEFSPTTVSGRSDDDIGW